MTCKCGLDMVLRLEWLGTDGFDMLGKDFVAGYRCPKRHLFNFYKHTKPKFWKNWP